MTHKYWSDTVQVVSCVASDIENKRNRQKRIAASSRFKGVDWYKRSAYWRARIRVDGRLVCLGRFSSEADAAAAYNAAAIEHYGEFARLNKLPEWCRGQR